MSRGTESYSVSGTLDQSCVRLHLTAFTRNTCYTSINNPRLPHPTSQIPNSVIFLNISLSWLELDMSRSSWQRERLTKDFRERKYFLNAEMKKLEGHLLTCRTFLSNFWFLSSSWLSFILILFPCFVAAIKCSVPEEIENGKVYYAALNFNATIRYECNYGFKLNGPEVRRCDQNKQWTAITTFIGPESGQSSPGGNLNPICKQIDCGSPGNLPNGFLEGQKTTLGSVIKFRCFDETTFDGTTNSTTCTESGKWSHPLPSCLAPCVVPLIENGRINSAAAGSKLPHGSIIEAICKPQYESAVSNTTVSMCNNGSWTVIPFCVPGKQDLFLFFFILLFVSFWKVSNLLERNCHVSFIQREKLYFFLQRWSCFLFTSLHFFISSSNL